MLTDSAWTRRRFLGALVASAVAAGVKIPEIPAAEPLVEAAGVPWGYTGARLEAEHYFLVIHPRAVKSIGSDGLRFLTPSHARARARVLCVPIPDERPAPLPLDIPPPT